MSPEHTLSMNPSKEQKLERCADVWFSDGTVVLQAENMLFKVYRGILEGQSPFFRDLFTLPQQDSNESEKYEDCPLVIMPDQAADVRNLFKAIFDHKFYSDVKTITDFSVILGVANLSHKYQVDDLLRRSLPAFTVLYPSSLEDWDTRSTRPQYDHFRAAYGKALPIFVIELARSYNVDVLLPSALFECCSFSVKDILCGVPAPDGTMRCLDTRDQVLVLQAREKLAQLFRTKVFAFVYWAETQQDVETIQDGLPIADRRAAWRKMHEWMQGIGREGWADPLTQSFPWDAFRDATANHMQRLRQLEVKVLRQAVWNELPAMFSLNLRSWKKRTALSVQPRILPRAYILNTGAASARHSTQGQTQPYPMTNAAASVTLLLLLPLFYCLHLVSAYIRGP